MEGEKELVKDRTKEYGLLFAVLIASTIGATLCAVHLYTMYNKHFLMGLIVCTVVGLLAMVGFFWARDSEINDFVSRERRAIERLQPQTQQRQDQLDEHIGYLARAIQIFYTIDGPIEKLFHLRRSLVEAIIRTLSAGASMDFVRANVDPAMIRDVVSAMLNTGALNLLDGPRWHSELVAFVMTTATTDDQKSEPQ